MKKTYHVKFDVIDDTDKFAEESGDKSDDIGNMRLDDILLQIQRGIKRFSKMELYGVHIANVEVIVPLDEVAE